MALGESPKLQASRLDLLAASEDTRAARAALWPNLSGTATGEAFSGRSTSTFSIVNTTSPSGTGINSNREVDLAGLGVFGAKLTYPLFKDGSIFGLNDAPAVERSKAIHQALEWTTHLTREEVIYRITQSYIAVVAAQSRVQPIDRRVTLLQQSSGITQEQQQKGLLLPIDVKVVNAELSDAQKLSKVLHEQAVAGSLSLSRLLGMNTLTTHIRLDSLPEPPEPPSAASLLGTSLTAHPSVQAQRATVARAKQDYRLERFRLYPSVTAHASALDVTDFTNDAHEFIGGVTVNIPIWDFGAQLAIMRARKDTYMAEQARLDSVADDVASEVLTIYEEIFGLSESILTLQGEVGKLDRDLRVAASQQQQGITPPLTTIDAELQLVGKRDQLEVMRSHRLLLYAALQRAMGGMWKWIE